MSDLLTEKKALRAEMLRRRQGMSAEERAEADSRIIAALLAHKAFRRARQVFAYVPMPHEVGGGALPGSILSAGKTLGLPVCDVKTHTMQFYRLDSTDELQEGAYRIPVPPVSAERLLTPDKDTLIVVPMLGIDAAGFRLGAGGGFYDRYLAAYPAETIGLCYAACRVTSLPHDSYDKPIQRCITEKTTEEFSHGES